MTQPSPHFASPEPTDPLLLQKDWEISKWKAHHPSPVKPATRPLEGACPPHSFDGAVTGRGNRYPYIRLVGARAIDECSDSQCNIFQILPRSKEKQMSLAVDVKNFEKSILYFLPILKLLTGDFLSMKRKFLILNT